MHARLAHLPPRDRRLSYWFGSGPSAVIVDPTTLTVIFYYVRKAVMCAVYLSLIRTLTAFK